MKRFIYTTIALAAVAVGCTKSNLVEGPQSMETPIEFETYNGRTPLTKASEITNTTIQGEGFHVTAFYSVDNSVYMDRDVTWSEGAWTYSPKAYWPATGDLNFVAYGLNAKNTLVVSDDHLTFTYTVPDVVADQEDLVASKFGDSTKSADDNGKVTIQMQHLLSKIGFQVKTIYTGNAPDAQVTIKNITLKGEFNKTGSVNLKPAADVTFKITPTADTEKAASYALFADGESFTAGASADAQPIYCNSVSNPDESSRYMMIMPGDIGQKPTIEVEYKLTGQNDFQKAVIDLQKPTGTENTTVPWTLEAGTAYEFIFTVSISSIDFTGEVVKWDELEKPIPEQGA